MDIIWLCLVYIFKISLYIIVIGGALVVIFLIYLLFRLIQIINLIHELVEDINYKYFVLESFFTRPIKFFSSLFGKRSK